MRFIRLYCTISALAIGLNSTAQDTDTTAYQYLLKANIAPLLMDQSLAIFYERQLIGRLNWVIGANYWHQGRDFPLFDPDATKTYRMAAITAEMKISLTNMEKPWDGLYISPYMRSRYVYMEVQDQNNDFELGITSIGAGVLFGGQMTVDRVNIDFFIGSTIYLYHSYQVYDNNFDFLMSDLRLGVCLGRSFKKK